MSDLIVIDDLIVDEQTGEVIEWPKDAPGGGPELVAWIMTQYQATSAGEKAFGTARQTWSRLLGRYLREFDGALRTESGRASWVAEGTRKTASALKVKDAVDAELLTDSQAAALLIAAAKDLDINAVEEFVDTYVHAQNRATVKAVLINKSPRAGYARVTISTPMPPRVAKRAEEKDLSPVLQESIDRLEAERMAH